MKKPLISVVVIAFNMTRELRRTLYTLEPSYQMGLDEDDLEIIVVDNGSTQSVQIPDKYKNITYLEAPEPSRSPAAAINIGLRNATSDFIGVMIDGARMASPQLLKYAVMANRLDSRVVVSTLGYHFGSEVQMLSVPKGYNQQVEDELLGSVSWEEDGYELFNISVFAGSSGNGWFSPITESNALFMSRQLWEELGGYDERFQSPGGGLVNHDTYSRACELPRAQLVTLLGEGTFHQVHGGIATNQKPGTHSAAFREEYKAIRGKNYQKPDKRALYLGEVRALHKSAIQASLKKL